VIGVALKTHLEIRLGICMYKTSLLHRPDDYIGFALSCPPHILQQNCAHRYECGKYLRKVRLHCLESCRPMWHSMKEVCGVGWVSFFLCLQYSYIGLSNIKSQYIYWNDCYCVSFKMCGKHQSCYWNDGIRVVWNSFLWFCWFHVAVEWYGGLCCLCMWSKVKVWF